jgi:hypothetical protein
MVLNGNRELNQSCSDLNTYSRRSGNGRKPQNWSLPSVRKMRLQFVQVRNDEPDIYARSAKCPIGHRMDPPAMGGKGTKHLSQDLKPQSSFRSIEFSWIHEPKVKRRFRDLIKTKSRNTGISDVAIAPARQALAMLELIKTKPKKHQNCDRTATGICK